jgi:ABC-type iron transport system FetAB ATPase subunit
MTGAAGAGENVLLLRFADFRTMDYFGVVVFKQRMRKAGDAELRRAYELFMEQTGGLCSCDDVRDLMVMIMKRLQIPYWIKRHEFDLAIKDDW